MCVYVLFEFLFMCCLTQLVKYALIKREIPNSHSLTEMYTQTHGLTHTHVQIHTHTLASLTHTHLSYTCIYPPPHTHTHSLTPHSLTHPPPPHTLCRHVLGSYGGRVHRPSSIGSSSSSSPPISPSFSPIPEET